MKQRKTVGHRFARGGTDPLGLESCGQPVQRGRHGVPARSREQALKHRPRGSHEGAPEAAMGTPHEGSSQKSGWRSHEEASEPTKGRRKTGGRQGKRSPRHTHPVKGVTGALPLSRTRPGGHGPGPEVHRAGSKQAGGRRAWQRPCPCPWHWQDSVLCQCPSVHRDRGLDHPFPWAETAAGKDALQR